MGSNLIDPINLYEIKGVPCKITPAVVDLAVGNNQSIIAAVTGKVHRLMGLVLQGSLAATIPRIYLKSNSGGTLISGGYWAPSGITNGGSFYLPIVDSGYGETTVGHGIFADVTVTSISGCLWYLSYTP